MALLLGKGGFRVPAKCLAVLRFFALNPPLLLCRNFVLALLNLQLQNKNRLESYTASLSAVPNLCDGLPVAVGQVVAPGA